jgi:tetratricopeptide (TPR) repeat protein
MARKISLVFFIAIVFISRLAHAQDATKKAAPAQVDYTQKIDSLSALIENSKSDKAQLADLYFLRGDYYRYMSEYEKAYKDYTATIKINPAYKDGYWNRGIASEGLKKYKDAISDYEKALKIVPETDSVNLSRLYTNIAYNESELHNQDKTLAYDSIAIKYNPAYGRAHFIRGNAYVTLKDYKTAIFEYEKAVRLYTDYHNLRVISIWYVALGEAKRLDKQYKEAINSYSFALKIDPDDRLAYWSRAGVYYIHKDYDLAEKDYANAISYYQGQDIQLSELYHDKANTEMAQGLLPQSVKDDSAALAHDPKNKSVYYDMANVYKQNGEYQKSIDLYNKVMDFYSYDNKSKSTLYYQIANAEYFMGEFDKVVKDCSKAISLYPASTGSYYYRGKVYLKKLDKKDLAMQDFNKVIELDTSHKSSGYIFSLFYTGKQDEATGILKQEILNANDDPSLRIYYYDLACLDALMNKTDEANNYLKMAIDKGYPKRFAMADGDLDSLRNTADYKAMMASGNN